MAAALHAVTTGLPPKEKPKLCDAACESKLENGILFSLPLGALLANQQNSTHPSFAEGVSIINGSCSPGFSSTFIHFRLHEAPVRGMLVQNFR
ncbi:hypothetical protein BS78_05G126600 [Paspalum vaginatum]|nr:hypothetical protein BS78_05G126600 [Paspalum vaginatum]